MTSHSYVDDANDSARIHTELDAIKDQLSSLIKLQGDESRACHKLLSDQLVSFDVRLRAMESDSQPHPRLDIYQAQVDFEHKLLRHQQEVKTLIGDVVRTEELKNAEEAMKRSNSLRIQTLEYRLKEVMEAQEEMRNVVQTMLRKEKGRETSVKTEDIVNQVYATSVQRIDKLLERELVPMLSEQEQRLAAGIDRRLAMIKDEPRSTSRGELELKQRVNALDDSLRALETSLLKSQSLVPDSRPSLSSRDDFKALEKTLQQTKSDFQYSVSHLETALKSLRNDFENASERLKTDIVRQGREVDTQLKAQREELEAQWKVVVEEVKGGVGRNKQELQALRGDYADSIQQVGNIVRRVQELENWVSSAQEQGPDALNESMVIDKYEDVSDKSPDNLATFGDPETIGKMVHQSRMKGGIRGIQLLHLGESSPEVSSRSATPGLTTEQVTADIFETLLREEMEHCVELLRPQELVLSSLDSYRVAVSPLLSWDPDEEQDEGANLSDRRVEVRRHR